MLLLLTTINGSFKTYCSTATATMALRNIDFEAYGRVQGVFFRKYIKQQADMLQLKGWCRNTSRGTVEGQMQGPSYNLEKMSNCLVNPANPRVLIEKVEFKNDKHITEYTFSNFDIRRDD